VRRLRSFCRRCAQVPAAIDLKIRQRLLKLGDSFVGNFGLPQEELLKTLESGKMFQPGIADRRAVEVEQLEILQTGDMLESVVVDLRICS
jgi:hypothetical protein